MVTNRQPAADVKTPRGKVFSNNTQAWIAQGSVLVACGILAVHGVLDGTASISVWIYGVELAVAMFVVITVGLAFLLRLQARAAGRLHPDALVVTAIANFQFVAQLRAAAQALGVRSGRGYSGTYYAVAFASDAIWIVLGSVRPKDIIRIPRLSCADVTVERAPQGVFMQNCIELHLATGDEQLVVDLLLLRPLALAAVPLGQARLDATAAGIRQALQLN
jgi:hypothetical protein